MARQGGNAVDAAVASALAAVVTHPAMCSLGGGGFLTILTPGGEVVTVDGGHEMPGRDLSPEVLGRGGVGVTMDYAGGTDVLVGPGSVATPGLLAGCALASRRWGRLPWKTLVEPAAERARRGFPMPPSSRAYLTFAHEPIYARDPRGRQALEREDGTLKEAGETIRVPGLADTLDALAREGPDLLYRGELGRRVAGHVREEGGILGTEDLRSYRPRVRSPVAAELDGWDVLTSPWPAVGGPTLVAMLSLLGEHPGGDGWTPEAVGHLVRVQHAVLSHRRRRVDAAEDPDGELARLLETAARGDPAGLLEEPGRRESASTLHVSAVDSEGRACAATFSDGYGSGIVPPGTGIWLNNCLGERELNPRGFHALAPGTRLLSNMTPTVGWGPSGGVLAIGSPGSERIPTAVLQALVNHLRLGMDLEAAVAHPRLHVEPEGPEGPATPVVHCEPGLPMEAVELPVRRYDGQAMFFGGVEAAAWWPGRGFGVAADARRTGGTALEG